MTVPGCANPLLMYGDAGVYQIERSLRFNSSDSASLSRASYAGSGTFSCWVKRCKLGTAQTIISGVAFNASDQLNSSTAVFRDPSAWMHVLVSTSGTYVNGTSVASGSAITPGIIGSGCDLYLADIHFIDGQALTPSSFTEVSATTGQLIPKAYTGSFGTNGFRLKFADNSSNTATTLGKDTSPNGNNWTPNNFNVVADYPKITLPVSNAPSTVECLLVAGGGGGGNGSDINGGGGGGGEVAYANALSVSAGSSYLISIGLGGGYIGNGGDTRFGSYTVFGGGGGAYFGGPYIGSNGGSGGGGGGSGGNYGPSAPGASTKVSKVGFLVYGNSGGSGYNNGPDNAGGGGGGGGAGGAGGSGNYSSGGVGGAGYSSSITGTTVSYGAGGDGGIHYSTSYLAPNTGRGGDAQYYLQFASGSSGIVVIKYPNTYDDLIVSSSLTYTYLNSGGYKIYSFTNSSSPIGNDSLVDTPTSYGTDTGAGGEVRGNYATLNPININTSLGTSALSNGNLDVSGTTANGTSTIAPNSGKWYAEFVYTAIGSSTALIGVSNKLSNDAFYGATQSWQLGYTQLGKLENAGSQSNVTTYTTNDVIGVAFDCSIGQVTFYKNGSSIGSITNSAFANVPVVIGLGYGGATGTNTATANFGQRPFAYTAPSGFKALCDTNLPAPVVAKPNTVFDVALWSGTSATQSITFQSGLSPDFVWIKARNDVANHVAFDVIRGANKAIYPSLTNAEDTYTATLTSFNSSGFTLGYDDWSGVNASGRTYVGWCWDAGSSTVTNTQGSITSSVRANASAGFSIVTYTGTGTANSTFGHGLGVAPALIINKNRGSANDWYIYHSSLGVSSYLSLNTTGAAGTLSNYWSPVNSTVFGQTYTSAGPNNGSQVAYCFAPVTGYSNGFSYTGNGSTDGVFVYLGLRAKLLLIKRTDTTGNWYLWDTVRNTYNVVGEELYPNLSNAAATATDLDILSNGFKMRSTAADFNASGGTYVGFAWAETPFVYSRAR